MDAPPPGPRRTAALAWAAGAGAVLAAAALRFCETAAGNIDDAFILLVYARHWITTGKFYYNATDGAVDGFTSPLDLWIKGAAIHFWPRDPIFVCWLITFLFHLSVALIGFYLAAKIARRYGYPRALLLAIATGLALAGSQGLADGSAFLLETPLSCAIGALLVGAVVIAPPPTEPKTKMARAAGLGLLIAALPLARPEGLPLAAIFCALHLARAREAVVRFLPVAIAGAILAVYYVWRIRYFGYWAPNTYYAKTSASRLNEIKDGFAYIAQFALSPGAPGLLVLLGLPSLAWVRGWSSARAKTDFLIVCGLSWISLAAVVYAGGDCYGGGRFLAFPLVFSIIALAIAAAGLQARKIARGVLWGLVGAQGAVMVAVPIVLAIVAPNDLRAHLRDNVPMRAASFDCDRQVAQKLALTVGGGVAAQTDYQRLKYFADDLYVRDLTGLNDRRIAHTEVRDPVRWGKLDLLDAAKTAPDAIVLGHHVGIHETPMGPHPLNEVFSKPELYNDYFGYTIAPVYIDALTAKYHSASISVCGGWFNFLEKNRDQNPMNRPSPGQP